MDSCRQSIEGVICQHYELGLLCRAADTIEGMVHMDSLY